MNPESVINESSTSSQRLRPALQPLRQPSRLPLEIWVQIFFLSLPPPDHPQAPQKTDLALVCRFWNLIVDSSPILWSQISIEDSAAYVQRSLSKSGNHSLDVNGTHLVDTFTTSYDAVCCRFLEQVQSSAGRWRHAALQVPPGREFTPSFGTLPSLQTLKLCARNRLELDDQFFALLNPRHAPLLREVSLCSLWIHRWDLISLSPNLSKLEILGVGGPSPLVPRWLSVLAACPNLTVFRLRDVHVSPFDHVEGDENIDNVVELNALQELEVRSVESGLIVELLARLRMPDECTISIGCYISSPTPSESFLTPAFSSQRNFRREGTPSHVTLGLNGLLLQVAVADGRWRIKLSLGVAGAIRDVLEWFDMRDEECNIPSSDLESSQAGFETSHTGNNSVTLILGPLLFDLHFEILRELYNFRFIDRIELNRMTKNHKQALLLYLSAPENPNTPTRSVADCFQYKSKAHKDIARIWPFPGLRELVRRESHDDAIYYVLVEPITGRSSDNGAAALWGSVARSDLAQPNTPWRTSSGI